MVDQLALPATTCPLPRKRGSRGLDIVGKLAVDGIGVVLDDRLQRAGAAAGAGEGGGCREDDDDVRAEAADLVLDARLGAVADARS